MSSPRKNLTEDIHRLTDTSQRYVDCAVRIRVWRRGAGGDAEPAELLPRAFGGVYDRFAARFVPGLRPARVTELKVHEGQLPVLSRIGDRKSRRILALGAPGGGKTMALVVVAVILGVRRSNGIIGVVAPTRDRLLIVWRKMLEVLEPSGLIQGTPSLSKKEIRLVNGNVYQFRAAARRSTNDGSPIAGHDWHDAVEDEQQDIGDDDLREVDARGRINADYQVFSSATNEARHEFQMRLREYAANDNRVVVRFSGPANAFTPLAHWEALKNDWSSAVYDQYINCLAPSKTGLVFEAFDYELSTAPLPLAKLDVTAQVVYDTLRLQDIQYIFGWDPGIVMSASVILKAFSDGSDRNWFVLDEVSTPNGSTEQHAKAQQAWLSRRGIPMSKVLVIGDPHENKEADKSDYIAMRNAGFEVRRSNGGHVIERKHRINMTNALLCDATLRRRLKLAVGPLGRPVAEKTAECFGGLKFKFNGEIDYHHKTYMNIAHWGEAAGYGLFPFEKFRGTFKAKPESTTQPGWRRAGS